MTSGQEADEPVVLVDARNVMRSRWPNIDEEEFLDSTRAWAERNGARIVAVFDGAAPGTGVGSREVDGRTSVVGTGRASADDWIAERASALAESGRRLWLVTSDRGLRERAAPHAERVLGGGSFAGALEALAREEPRSRRD